MSDRYDDGLMVGCSVDRGQAVGTSRKTVSDVRSEDTSLGNTVETLEKGKATGIGGGGLLKRVEELDNDVRVTNDLSATVQLLRSGKVVLLGVDKVTSLHVANGHLDGERSVGCNGSKVLGEDKLGGWHVVDAGDGTNGRGVARAFTDLLAIGDLEVGDSQAKVDKVVGRSQ